MAGNLTVSGDGLKRFENLTSSLARGEIGVVAKRALNHTGNKARTQVRRALTKQTGLSRKVIVKAVEYTPATGGNSHKVDYDGQRLAYTMTTSGGDIALKYFKARETRKGVSAAPFGNRGIFEGRFIKGGKFPGRVELGMGGQVFRRTGDWHIAKSGKYEGQRRAVIEAEDSGVVIPDQMVIGETAKAFRRMGPVLDARLSHEVMRSRKLQDLSAGLDF